MGHRVNPDTLRRVLDAPGATSQGVNWSALEQAAALPAAGPGLFPDEAALVTECVRFAQSQGWLAAHFLPQTNRRGRTYTAMQGDPGVPDVLLARGEFVIFLEGKIPPNRPNAAQRKWLDCLNKAHVFASEFTPVTWPSWREFLTRK